MRPTHYLSGLLVTGALLAGCGGHSAAPQLRQGGPSYTAPQVDRFLQGVTGETLHTDAGGAFDSLMPSDSRNGTYLVYVLHGPGGDVIYNTDGGRKVKPDANGVYWHNDDGTWSAMKPYHNVVLEYDTPNRRLDAGFRRLDAVLSKLGKPIALAKASLPADDQSCADRGIGGTGPDGTCRQGGATVTVVDRDEPLKIPSMTVSVTRVESGNVVIPPHDYGLVRHAKGRFVLAAIKLTNTGDEPVNDLAEVELRIGDKTYSQSDEATWTVTPMDAFPVQPGASTMAGLVFDVPPAAADQALGQGLLAFPAGGEYATVEDSAKVGEIRLAAPPAAHKS